MSLFKDSDRQPNFQTGAFKNKSSVTKLKGSNQELYGYMQ